MLVSDTVEFRKTGTSSSVFVSHSTGPYVDFINSSGTSLGYVGDSQTEFMLTARSGILTKVTAAGGFSLLTTGSMTFKYAASALNSFWVDGSTPQTLIVGQSNSSAVAGRVHVAGHTSTGLQGRLTFGLALTDIRTAIESYVVSGGNAYMTFNTMNAALVLGERARLTSEGDFGLGTTAPSKYAHGGTAKLLELYNASTGSNSQSHLILSTGATANVGSAGAVTWVAPNVSGSNKMLACVAGLIATDSTSAPYGALAFFTANGSALVEQARMSPAGCLGLGRVPTAYGRMDINGSVLVGSTGSESFRVSALLSAQSTGADPFMQLVRSGVGAFNYGVSGASSSVCNIDFGGDSVKSYRFYFGGSWYGHPASAGGTLKYSFGVNNCFLGTTTQITVGGTAATPALDIGGNSNGFYTPDVDALYMTLNGVAAIDYLPGSQYLRDDSGNIRYRIAYNGAYWSLYDEAVTNPICYTAGGNWHFGLAGAVPTNARVNVSGSLALFGQDTTSLTSSQLTTNTSTNPTDVVRIYPKADKLVIAYQVSGAVKYVTLNLDATTGAKTWTMSTTAP